MVGEENMFIVDIVGDSGLLSGGDFVVEVSGEVVDSRGLCLLYWDLMGGYKQVIKIFIN